jgi:hypothetical protein
MPDSATSDGAAAHSPGARAKAPLENFILFFGDRTAEEDRALDSHGEFRAHSQ